MLEHEMNIMKNILEDVMIDFEQIHTHLLSNPLQRDLISDNPVAEYYLNNIPHNSTILSSGSYILVKKSNIEIDILYIARNRLSITTIDMLSEHCLIDNIDDSVFHRICLFTHKNLCISLLTRESMFYIHLKYDT